MRNEGGVILADRAPSRHESDKEISVPPKVEAGAEAAQEEHDKIGDEPPPNGGYGWVCVTCVALVNAHTWGINSVRCQFLHAFEISKTGFANSLSFRLMAYSFPTIYRTTRSQELRTLTTHSWEVYPSL